MRACRGGHGALAAELAASGGLGPDRIVMLLAFTALLSALFQVLYGWCARAA